MKSITSLQELLHTLPKCSGNDFVEIARNMHIPVEELIPYAEFSPDTYTRNCIARTDDFELLLLCWEELQETDIHCHNGEECWVYLAQGKIREKRFVEKQKNEIEQTADVKMQQERLSYMNDDMGYHSLHNIAKGRTMTLHLYVGPIDECTVYDFKKKKFVAKDLQYHTYKGEKVTA
ncbi:MAG: cysteine dioxygenase [Bacteroidota bacterium]